MNLKICLIVDCLSKGGSEKVAASLSKSLYDKGYNISIISIRDDVSYDYKGDLFNLGKNESSIKIIKQIKKLLLFNKHYKKIDADFYIDFRVRNRIFMELMLHVFTFKMRKMIMTFHSNRIYYHIPKAYFFKRLYNKSKVIVSVSNGVLKAIQATHNYSNLYCIPNFYSESITKESNKGGVDIKQPFILAVGRLKNEIKQFDRLILAYKETDMFKEHIPLYILGDGSDKKVLEYLIETHHLQNHVKLLGFKDNPYLYMKHCKFLVLSSKNEGFSMVILEALALGTPVVSFNCKSGPAELISHKENGLLIEDQNFEALAKNMDLMEKDTGLYNKCKLNAANSVLNFSEKSIMKKWEQLFRN